MRQKLAGAKGHLKRSLGSLSAILIVVGTVVGSAVFLVPAEITRQVPSPGFALCVWTLAGVITLLGALNFSELAAAYPGSGGPYVYFEKAFGPMTAYVYGWAITLIIQPGGLAAEAAGIAKFSPYLLPLSEHTLKVTESLVLIAFTGINLLKVSTGKSVLKFTTVLKLVCLAAIGLAACFLPHTFVAANASAPTAMKVSGVTFSGFGLALVAAFWGFDGWANLSYIAGEVKEPGKNIPRAFGVGILIATALFLLINFGLYRCLPIGQIAGARFPLGDLAASLGGKPAFAFILFCVGLATLTCLNSSILSGARMAHSMAARGDLPEFFAYVHPKNQVPTVALCLQLGITLLLLWSGSYESLFTYVMSASFAFYALAGLAVIKLRWSNQKLKRPFRMPLYPMPTILYLLFTLSFLANTLWNRPRESLLGFGLIACALPVYWVRKKRATGTAAICLPE